jgi:hypothetical protein
MSKLVPPVTVELDRIRTLVMDMAAVALIEEWTGKDIIAGERPAGTRGLNAMLAAMLSAEDPEMTPVKAGRLVDSAERLKLAADATAEAIARFFGASAAEVSQAKAAIETAAASPTSTWTSSGPSGDTISGSQSPNFGG